MLDNLIGPERPMSWVLQFWPVLVFSFISALAATALCKRIALKFGIVDRPDDQVKTHKGTVAYLGGVGMLAGLTAGVLAGIYYLHGKEHLPSTFTWLLGVLAGGAIACFVGLVDDIFNLRPYQKMLGQVIAALILVAAGIRPSLSFLHAYLGLHRHCFCRRRNKLAEPARWFGWSLRRCHRNYHGRPSYPGHPLGHLGLQSGRR
ncbi:MAG: hypothetical protein ACYTAO_08355 [Planctomycetota bacterium]